MDGLHMNLKNYLVNQLDQDFFEAQDQGYEFHFSWLLILITFISWEMLEGATFLELEPSEPLVVKFTSLSNSSNMGKNGNQTAVFTYTTCS
jgi:hypothetical protein